MTQKEKHMTQKKGTTKEGARYRTGLILAVASMLTLLPAFSLAQTPFRFQYAVKFLCTANIPGTSQTTPSVLPGVYQTAVNIHNPNNRVVEWRKKIALAPGPISKFIEDRLKPDEATRVDCDQVVKDFGPFIHGVEGFLVIESTDSLDVTAVYTAGKRGGEVESIAVEQIRERRIR
jgi:hypothetical protein